MSVLSDGLRTLLFGNRASGNSAVPVTSSSFSEVDDVAFEMYELSCVESYARDLAFFSCVNVIANAVSKCEFKTFVKNKEKKSKDYYLFNVQPNLNDNSSRFMQEMVYRLYFENEVLIVPDNDGYLHIADGFTVVKKELYPNIYQNVSVGDFTFKREFLENEVIRLRLPERMKIKTIVDQMNTAYSKVLAYATDSYTKSKGRHIILQPPSAGTGTDEQQKKRDNFISRKFKPFLEADNAVLNLPKGYVYSELNDRISTSGNNTSRDIKALVDDICDMTAKAFCIPPALLNGNVEGTKEAMSHFLTFCIDPLCDMIQEELNRKFYSRTQYLNGMFIRIDTKCILHTDLFEVATSIDKLISSGAFCINDIRVAVGDMPIDADWAYEHFLTKNYALVADVADGTTVNGKGGEANGEKNDEILQPGTE